MCADSTEICASGNFLISRGDYPIFPMPSKKTEALPPLVLRLRPEFFDTLFLSQMMDCPLFYDLLRANSSAPQYFHFDTYPTDLSWRVGALLLEEVKKPWNNIKNVHAACMLLLTNLHEIHRERLLITSSTMMPENKIGEVLTYMSNHYREISLSSVAEAFHYSPAYFSGWFKKNAKISFQEQLLKLRLEQAKLLLRNTNLPVHTIIEEIGFTEKSHFHRCFRAECGMTPLAYRRKG